jgi:hypothetical protein
MAPHPQRLTVTRRGWALARPLTTAHGVKTTADVVIAKISDGNRRGLRIMVGGTIGTSLAIAPALRPAPAARLRSQTKGITSLLFKQHYGRTD